MSLTTYNKYGKLSISEDVVAVIASVTASECYGVVDLVSRRFSDNFSHMFNHDPYGKGVRVITDENYIYIDVYPVLKIGVNVEAVKKSLADTITFNLEKLTGMRVKHVQVNVVGIRI